MTFIWGGHVRPVSKVKSLPGLKRTAAFSHVEPNWASALPCPSAAKATTRLSAALSHAQLVRHFSRLSSLLVLPPATHYSHPLRLDTIRLPSRISATQHQSEPFLVDNTSVAFSHCLIFLREAHSDCGSPCRHPEPRFCWPPDGPKPHSLLSHLF